MLHATCLMLHVLGQREQEYPGSDGEAGGRGQGVDAPLGHACQGTVRRFYGQMAGNDDLRISC